MKGHAGALILAATGPYPHCVLVVCGALAVSGTFVMIIMWRLLSKHERDMAALGVKDADAKARAKQASKRGDDAPSGG